MKYDLIAFDLDGVLLNSEDYSEGGWIHRFARRVLTHLGTQPTLANMKKLSTDYIRNNLCKTHQDFGLDSLEELWTVREKFFLEEKSKAIKNNEIELFPDAKVLSQLNGDYRLAIVSNSPQSIVNEVLSYFDFEEMFEIAIGRSSELKGLLRSKPNPHLLLTMLNKTQPLNPVYIGDTDSDRRAAVQANIDFIHLDRNQQDLSQNHTVSDLFQLKGLLEDGFTF